MSTTTPPVMRPPKRPNWFLRHWILTTLAACITLLVIMIVAVSAALSMAVNTAGSGRVVHRAAVKAGTSTAQLRRLCHDDGLAKACKALQRRHPFGPKGYLSQDTPKQHHKASRKTNPHPKPHAQDKPTPHHKASQQTQPTPKQTPKPKPKPQVPAMTLSQQNAVESAQEYLSMGDGMSRRGLIQQLHSHYGEGFSRAAAVYAADHVQVNWFHQAYLSAKSYLQTDHFSHSGLVQQLHSNWGEGFTLAQAEYAVQKVGL